MDGGASPRFSPQHPDQEAAQAELTTLVRRDPQAYALDRSRWTLTALTEACAWLAGRAPGTVHALLTRLHLSWQHARHYVRSPDAAYAAKNTAIAEVRIQAHASAGRIVLLYLDEVTVYRQPTLAFGYSACAADALHAVRSHAADTATRIVATLDDRTGQVVPWRGTKITPAALVQFYAQVRAAYPQAETISIVQDNWPIHFHADVLAALVPQKTPCALRRPSSWSNTPSGAAVRRAAALGTLLPIQILPLPTYASWCNPIDKLWRWMRQAVTHLHRWADRLDHLRTARDHFLARFATGSRDLLRYVGLG